MDGTRICILLIVAVCALLLLILLPLSFSTVEYYEYGVVKRKSTGFVRTGKDDKVYTGGRYAIGPDHTFKKFRADAHFELLKEINVFTRDKVEVTLTFAFQYFLFKQDLKDLHNEYDLFYGPVVRSKAMDAIKGEAAKHMVQSYLTEREKMENTLGNAIRLRLEGRCCRTTCAKCQIENCIEYRMCKKEDKGLFVNVKFYQLLEVDIHSEMKTQYLKQVTELAEEERAKFVLEEKVERKKTDQEKNRIYNEAREIYQNATAEAAVIIANAKAQSLSIIENQRAESLKALYTAANLTTTTQKASFNFIRALRENKKAKLYVGFQNLQARS